MRTTETLIVLSSALFIISLIPLERARAESEIAAGREQAAQVAEKKAEIAKEEVELTKEAEACFSELAEKQAALAEKKATVAKEEARVTKRAVEQAAAIEQKLAELNAKETERGLELTLRDVLFETDRADLKPQALEDLYPMVTFLREDPDRHILIEGHTDSMGSESYNRDLSQQRAAAVQHFLVRNGISPERITAHGYGKADPVASNNTEAGRQQNRRVEVVVLHEGELASRWTK
jgi:outer membrane protein OmpA-like peptidoglycan-associated protein